MSIYLENLQARLVEELRRVGPPVIAKQTGIARATVYNWMEKGNIPMDKLALLEVAGADVNYILTGDRAGGAPSVPALDAAEQVLLDSYRRCGATAKQNLIQTAALLSAGLGGSGVATVAHATGGVSQSNVHGSNHFVAGDSATSMPTKRRAKAA